MLKIRARLPSQSTPAPIEIAADSPWISFLLMLESMSGIEHNRIRVLSGFPPKPINPDDDAAPLSSLGLRNNDMITVQAGEARVMRSKPGERLVPAAPPLWHFTRRAMPADNSCLFHACAYVLKNKSRSDGPSLREQCVQMIVSRPDMFNVNTLGQTPESYAGWLYSASSWGGGVELQILSMIYKTEIFALDLESSTVQRFGTDEGYDARAFVVYTGNHYDAVALNKDYNSFNESGDQVLFNPKDNSILEKAKSFVKEEGEKLRSKR